VVLHHYSGCLSETMKLVNNDRLKILIEMQRIRHKYKGHFEFLQVDHRPPERISDRDCGGGEAGQELCKGRQHAENWHVRAGPLQGPYGSEEVVKGRTKTRGDKEAAPRA
jgi:hypothetical protein